MRVTWISQGGYICEVDRCRLIVDPYLSDYGEVTRGLTRLVPPPFTAEQLQPDIVVCTHDHLDHFDPLLIPQLDRIYRECTFVGPRSVVRHYAEVGIRPGQTVLMAPGDSQTLGPFQLSATVAYHSDPTSIGLVIEAADRTLYVSGDTEYRDDLAPQVAHVCGGDIDIVFICINGRMKNMNAEEALQVVRVLDPRLVVPMHYGLFAENTVDPEPFLADCERAGLRAMAFPLGREMVLKDVIGELERYESH